MESNRGPAPNQLQREHNDNAEDEVIRNPNPKANENIRVRTEEPQRQTQQPAQGVGSEITDGEDG